MIHFRLALALSSLIASGCSNTRTYRSQGVTIQYPSQYASQMEPLARSLAPWLAAKLAETDTDPRRAYDTVRDNQSQALSLIAGKLGLDHPSKTMRVAYRTILRKWKRAEVIGLDPRRLTLIAGEWAADAPIPSSVASVDLSMSSRLRWTPWGTPVITVSLPEAKPLSVVVHLSQGPPPVELTTRQVENVLSICPLAYARLVGATFHEVTELAMHEDLAISGERRRWFVEGVATCVAWETLRTLVSEDAAGEYIARRSTVPYENIKQTVQLSAWRFDDNPRSHDQWVMHDARYAFATHEILGLIDRHGTDVIRRILLEANRARSERPRRLHKDVTTIDHLLDAITRVTGEDFRQHLAAYNET